MSDLPTDTDEPRCSQQLLNDLSCTAFVPFLNLLSVQEKDIFLCTQKMYLSLTVSAKTAKTDPVKTPWLCELAEYWQELEQAVVH